MASKAHPAPQLHLGGRGSPRVSATCPLMISKSGLLAPRGSAGKHCLQGPQSRLGLQGRGRARRPCVGIQGRDISWEDRNVWPQLGPCLMLACPPSLLCLLCLQEHRSLCVQQVPWENGAGPFNRECVTKGRKEERARVRQVRAACHSSKRGWTSLAHKSQAHGDRFTGQLGHRQGAQQEHVLHALLPQRPSQVGQVWGQKACPQASAPFPVPQGLLRPGLSCINKQSSSLSGCKHTVCFAHSGLLWLFRC